MSKSFQMCQKSQKKDKKIYETFKGFSRVSIGETFFPQNLFSVPYNRKKVSQKKGSFRGYTGTSSKGFVDFVILF